MSNGNGNHVEESAEEIAKDVRSRVDDVTAQARLELTDMQDQVRAMRRELINRALTVKDKAVGDLQAAAARIRREANETQDAESVGKAEELAVELERTASYLDRHTFRQLQSDVAETAQENVVEALAIAFVVGLLLGLVIGMNRRD
jgi:ElaB/YqjD/DUF883 family membrane-anchored ribosome-binding protein